MTHYRFAVVAVLAGTLSVPLPGLVHAQQPDAPSDGTSEGQPPPQAVGDEGAAPTAEDATGPSSGAAPGPSALAAPRDETESAYRRGQQAFRDGRWAEAAAAFEEVARRSPDPARRAMASELAAAARSRMQAETRSPAPSAATRPSQQRSLEDLRERIADFEGVSDPKTEVVLASMGVGWTVWSWGIPTLLGLERSAFLGSALLIGAASFFVPLVALDGDRLHPGAAAAFTQWSLAGAGQGLLLAVAIEPRTFQGLLAPIVLLSLAEGIGGAFLADAMDLRPDRITAMTALGGHAAWTLPAIGFVAFGDDLSLSTAFGLGFVGSYLGATAGWLLHEQLQWTSGDSITIGTGMLMGFLAGAVVMSYFPDAFFDDLDSASRVTAAVLLGSTYGGALLVGSLVDDADITLAQAGLLWLGTLAGGAVGLGLLALMDFPESRQLAATLLGGLAIGGFATTFALLDMAPEGELQRLRSEYEARRDEQRPQVSLVPWSDGRSAGASLTVHY